MPSRAPAVKSVLQLDESTGESIGIRLSRTRIAQGLTLDDISKATKIRSYFLKLLEEDNFDALPDVVYTTGFIRSYCENLDITAEPLIESYLALSTKKESDIPFKLYVPQASEKIITPRIALFSLLIMAVTSLLWYLLQTQDEKKSSTKNDVASVSHNEMTLKDLSPDVIKDTAQESQATETLSKNEDNQSVNNNEQIIDESVSATQATSSTATQTAAKAQAIPTQTSTNLTTFSAVPTAQDQRDLTIKAIKETWFKITDDQGARLKVFTLKKGDTFSLKPHLGNTISVGNAENVEFTYGDKHIKGPDYLETPNGFAEGKKIIAPRTSDMVQSSASDVQPSAHLS